MAHAAAIALLGVALVTGATADTRDALAAGEYIARAGGCLSCHREDLSGDYPMETPMGTIYATNISPSVRYGIGSYSLADFDRATRFGRTPTHRLYPAMPYASYRGMTDQDVRLLYDWIMAQPPVDRPPEDVTRLPFPFNIRLLMLGWKALALDEPDNVSEQTDPVLARGAYLTDHLGHCGECHTPRTQLYAMDLDQYLGGTVIDGWLAPNLTADPVGGMGAWPRQAIVDYLRTGYSADVAQAAGSMATFVHHATRHLDDDDLQAIAAYLQQVPAIPVPGQTRPTFPPDSEALSFRHDYGELRSELAASLADTTLEGIQRVYVTECAACHGVAGQGQTAAYYPPLVENVSLRRADPNNLVRVLHDGVPPKGLYRTPGMPGYGDVWSHAEIAEMANFLRVQFGGHETSTITAAHVADIMEGEDPPVLIALARPLAWAGVVVGVLIAALIGWWLWRRRRGADRADTGPAATQGGVRP